MRKYHFIKPSGISNLHQKTLLTPGQYNGSNNVLWASSHLSKNFTQSIH